MAPNMGSDPRRAHDVRRVCNHDSVDRGEATGDGNPRGVPPVRDPDGMSNRGFGEASGIGRERDEDPSTPGEVWLRRQLLVGQSRHLEQRPETVEVVVPPRVVEVEDDVSEFGAGEIVDVDDDSLVVSEEVKVTPLSTTASRASARTLGTAPTRIVR